MLEFLLKKKSRNHFLEEIFPSRDSKILRPKSAA